MKKAILLLALALAGCGGGASEELPIACTEFTPNVYRCMDESAGVVCWIYRAPSEGGISCLPLEQTRLGGR